MSLEKHEEKYVHISKKTIGIILYFLVSFGSYGYLIYRCAQHPELSGHDIAIPFVILSVVIIALPISYFGAD